MLVCESRFPPPPPVEEAHALLAGEDIPDGDAPLVVPRGQELPAGVSCASGGVQSRPWKEMELQVCSQSPVARSCRLA